LNKKEKGATTHGKNREEKTELKRIVREHTHTRKIKKKSRNKTKARGHGGGK